ncbi:MAG: NAD(P)H-dependent oxidoreductase, partial [Clostridia bacterium]
MNIVVLNGSPKGKNSVTLQTVLYLEKVFPSCKFNILNVGAKIRAYEKDMSEAISAIKASDLALFCYPVYTFLVPYQLHRFIELLKGANVNLSGKFVTQISTSKHFYDVTAHKFIEQNVFDMNGLYIDGLSADMDDLLAKKGQNDAKMFWEYVLYSASHNLSKFPKFATSIDSAMTVYSRDFDDVKVEKDGGNDCGKLTVIVTDCAKDDQNLKNMIADFESIHPYKTKLVNINDFPFKGGCLGCFSCAGDGKCVYTDGFDTFLRQEIQSATAIVYAFTIRDHSMGSRFKLYDDRQFCNGHRTVTIGMPIGYLVSGDYRTETNLQAVIEGRAEVGHNFLAGVAVNSQEISAMSQKIVYADKNKFVMPQNFYGVGGLKIFRDLIYIMRGLMKADHKFYKQHGFYDDL